MANKQHAQFSDENGNLFYLENQTEDVLDPSGKPLSDGGDLSEASVKFSVDTSRKLPQSGGRFKAFLGSIVKYLTDLGAAAYLAVANNDTTTQPGFVGDARVLKQHRDAINQLNSDFFNRFANNINLQSLPLSSAIAHIIDNNFSESKGSFDVILCASEGWFRVEGYRDLDGSAFGFANSISSVNIPYCYDRRAGADAVLKKLGNLNFTLTFGLSCGATVNINGTVITPSASGTVTLKCKDGVITSTSGTHIQGGMSGTPHSNEAHADVSNFKLTIE